LSSWAGRLGGTAQVDGACHQADDRAVSSQAREGGYGQKSVVSGRRVAGKLKKESDCNVTVTMVGLNIHQIRGFSVNSLIKEGREN
jgi:hypothetical protein